MPGDSLFAGVYVLLGQQFPLSPQMYRQQAVCEQDGVPFHSKVDLAVQTIQTFQPLADTHTHVLTDTWYTHRHTWRAARQRGWDFTGGLKANRQLRVVGCDGQRQWQSLAEYAAGLRAADFQAVAVAAQRWTVETLFADFKELMGSDQYQVRSAQGEIGRASCRERV